MPVQRSYVEIGPRDLSYRHGDYLGDESLLTRRSLEPEVVEPAAQKLFSRSCEQLDANLPKQQGYHLISLQQIERFGTWST